MVRAGLAVKVISTASGVTQRSDNGVLRDLMRVLVRALGHAADYDGPTTPHYGVARILGLDVALARANKKIANIERSFDSGLEIDLYDSDNSGDAHALKSSIGLDNVLDRHSALQVARDLTDALNPALGFRKYSGIETCATT